ncbi:MAG: VWA domain-containing protein [Herpetosiphonaceae bacterium]|nr:VWA domain-containing protein [Herpetosiphonaceae bacterium]
MSLLWPWFLLLLPILPLLVAAYIWLLRRRRRGALRYSSLMLIRMALPKRSRVRRHLPFAFFLLALTSLIIALARPVATVSVPSNQSTIMLAIDVSRSMGFTDIQPSRLEAAQSAALSFIRQQKSGTQIGIVAFSGYAALIQPPTSDRGALQVAIESLTMGRSTAIGSGILESVDAIATIDKKVAPSVADTAPASGVIPAPAPKGVYAPDIIVLLTDGVSNAGPLPLDAAQQAVDRGVRVYTIGFGTANGSAPFDGNQGRGGTRGGGGGFGGGGFGGGGFGGGFGGFRRGIDEETLKQVATMTGGNYYSASSAGELQSVLQHLPTYVITKRGIMEISVAFTAVGALLAVLAIGLAQLWHPLP